MIYIYIYYIYILGRYKRERMPYERARMCGVCEREDPTHTLSRILIRSLSYRIRALSYCTRSYALAHTHTLSRIRSRAYAYLCHLILIPLPHTLCVYTHKCVHKCSVCVCIHTSVYTHYTTVVTQLCVYTHKCVYTHTTSVCIHTCVYLC